MFIFSSKLPGIWRVWMRVHGDSFYILFKFSVLGIDLSPSHT